MNKYIAKIGLFLALFLAVGLCKAQQENEVISGITSGMIGSSVSHSSNMRHTSGSGTFLLGNNKKVTFGNSQSSNQNEKGDFNLNINYSSGCKEFTAEIFWKSYHPGADYRQDVAQGKINEANPGQGFNCYFADNWFVHVVNIERNSQRGKSALISIGGTLESPNFHGFSLLLHGEVGHLDYEVPRYGLVVSGYLPIISIEARYKISKSWSVGYRQYSLPADGIRLYSIVLLIKS